MLQQACGEDCLSCTQCHEWYQYFKSGRMSIEDDPKYGGDRRKFDTGPSRRPAKHVPQMEKNVGSDVSRVDGSFLKVTGLIKL